MIPRDHPLLERTVLGDALTAVQQEQEWLTAEIQAFTDFHDRIKSIQTQADHTPDKNQIGALSPQLTVSMSSDPFVEIRDAYRETIFEVDHWQDAYSEQTVADSVANEFSPELADVVCDPSGARFTLVIATKLTAEIENTIQDRRESHAVVEAEATELETLATELDEVYDLLRPVIKHDEPFAEQRSRIDTAITTLDELAKTHQAYVHDRSSQADQLLMGMVYRELETSYPGLSAVATVRQAVDRLNHHFWAGYT